MPISVPDPLPVSRAVAAASEAREPRDDRTAVVGDELELARLGVTAVLHAQGIEVVAETNSGRELASVAALEEPDLVVVGRPADLSLVDTVRRVLQVRPRPVVVAMVASGDEDTVGMLIALGARGVALRSGGADELSDIVASVLKGEPLVVPSLHQALAGTVKPPPLDDRVPELLSTREREVLACLAQGRSNREIAASLSVTLATVKSHLVRIYSKLGATNRNECLGRAVSLGLLK
jgi:DNA-binding NarL/FixJ family response regulator